MSSHKSDSVDSLESIGIGQASVRLKLIPDGLTNPNDRLFDCVVALIYCPKHRKVAVMNTRREHIVWAPFLQLREGQSWVKGTEDCIQRAIGRQDAELSEAEAAKQAPTFELSYLEVMLIQVPSVNSITRVCQLATLKGGSFKCCTKSHTIDWIPLSAIGKGQYAKDHWGPELQMWCTQLEKVLKNDSAKPPRVIQQKAAKEEMKFFGQSMKESAEYKAMQAIHFKPAHAIEVYEDFLKHCYPSLYMKLESFRLYLAKNAYTKSASATDKKQLQKTIEDAQKTVELYDLFRTKKNDYIDFQELLSGLVALDPHCKDKCELRWQFLFRYYAKGKGALDDDGLRRLAVEMNAGGSKIRDVNEQGNKLLKSFGVSTADKVTFTVFARYLKDHASEMSKLLRFQQSVLAHTSPLFSRKVRKPEEPKSTRSISKQNGEQCFACRKKDYEYSMHVINLEADGSCIPSIIDQNSLQSALYPEQRKYSIEYVFSNSSINNTLLDMVRIFNRTKPSGGLLSAPEEASCLLRYLQRLCRTLNGILSGEPKLLRLNGPAIIIGDLAGNLNQLLAYEEMLFVNFPVIPENLLFLGNYSGECQYGVECLSFLFAMKITSPNKVFLLRGNAETRAQSSKSLRNECFNKYGRQKGHQIFEMFNEIFPKLPVAAVLDESILAVHSGIPVQNRKIADALGRLPAAIVEPQKDAPIVDEILTRYPLSYKHIVKGSLHTVDVDLLGHHHGDLAYHSEQRSLSIHLETSSISTSNSSSAVKSKSATKSKGKSNLSLKSGLDQSYIKSTQSGRSYKSIKTNAGIPLEAKSRSTKSISVKSKHPKEATTSVASNCASVLSVNSKVSKVSPSSVIRSTPSTSTNKSSASTDSKCLSKLTNIPSETPSQSSTYQMDSFKAPSEVDPLDQDAFDGNAFAEFMSYNKLTYLVRGSSVCKYGFKLNFKSRCITLFSCLNFAEYQNDAAVLLVSRETTQLRLLTLKAAAKQEEAEETQSESAAKVA